MKKKLYIIVNLFMIGIFLLLLLREPFFFERGLSLVVEGIPAIILGRSIIAVFIGYLTLQLLNRITEDK